MKMLMMAMMGVAVAFGASAASQIINGVLWNYTVSGGKATITSCSVGEGVEFRGSLPSYLNGYAVTSIAEGAFMGNKSMVAVRVPGTIKSLGNNTFRDCTNLQEVILEEGVERLSGYLVFCSCTALKYISFPSTFVSFFGDAEFLYCHMDRVDFLCGIPLKINEGINTPNILGNGAYYFGKKHAGQWINTYGVEIFGGYVNVAAPLVKVVSSRVRESDPTVMDVVYKVTSQKPSVKVRVLAFEDGERSFAKVVRPETFVDGTGVNVGDNITPNVEHKISWRVSGDWTTKLAKVKFEVLASEGELLPLETMTIPASQQYGKMKITWNAISESQVFDALLWLYADKDPGLTLSGGTLKNGSTALVSGTQLSGANSYYDEKGNYVGSHWVPNTAAPSYVLQKMGYSLLTGAPLTYANQETRLGLSPSGARQYGYKIVE